MIRRVTRRSCGALAVLAVLSTSAAACGSSSNKAAGKTQATPARHTALVKGCGASSYTDLQVRTDFVAPHCDAGAPAPKPLATKTTLKIAMSAKTSALAIPVLLGLEKGEFAKENLDVQVQVLPPSDSLGLVAQGNVDVLVSSLTAAYFNAVKQGFDIRWVLSEYYDGKGNKEGFWAKGDNVQLKDLKGKRIGTAVGLGSPVSLMINDALKKVGLTMKDLNLQTLPVTDVPTALQNGAVDGAVLVDPLWLPFQNKPGYTDLVGAMPPGEPLTGVFFGPSILTKNRDAGVAFTRAFARTISTYLPDTNYKTGPYKDDIAKAIQATPSYFQVPPQVWDWEVKKGTTDRMQETFISLGAVNYPTPISESGLVDRSFIGEAVGHAY